MPESYYKRGKAQELLGTPDAARASYELLIKTHPDTPSAGLAKQALDRLGVKAATPRHWRGALSPVDRSPRGDRDLPVTKNL